jgi:quinoprotein dehydrogenase-associated probable ABC transporter substrate-binding protein
LRPGHLTIRPPMVSGSRSMPLPEWFARAGALAVLALTALMMGADASAATEREVRTAHYLTVCGDPNNLPYSNDRMEGFENKIAELIASELGRPLHYRWWPQTVGFVRNTLRARLCDLAMGISSANDLVQNTNPYYRSVYVMVYRSDAGLRIRDLKDPVVKGLRIGVVAGTPPASLLSDYGLLSQIRSYERTVDTRLYAPARQAVEDVAKGDLDLALIWGPIAGYVAKQQGVPLTLTPMPAQLDGVPLAFNVSMGIRPHETVWKHELNAVLDRLAPRIQEILLGYGVPLLDDADKPIGTGSAGP